MRCWLMTATSLGWGWFGLELVFGLVWVYFGIWSGLGLNGLDLEGFDFWIGSFSFLLL
jgi:hypothetical protein